MNIAEGMDESSSLDTEEMREDMDEERVGCDIERYSEKEICRSLVELTIELSSLDRVLGEFVTDRISRRLIGKCHRVEIFRIPGCETAVTSIGIFL